MKKKKKKQNHMEACEQKAQHMSKGMNNDAETRNQ